MTLIVTINGPETIWVLADRRLSYKNGRTRDDARKVMFLRTTDGVAIVGYAGLGATALGTEPADWMSAVLRGRNLSLEQSLGVLAETMKRQLPRHMIELPGPAHNVFVPAFVGEESRLYTVDLVFTPDRKSYSFRYTRHVLTTPSGTTKTPPFGLAGSGGRYLSRNKIWIRSLLRVIRAHDRGKVSPRAVADYLAELNREVHLSITDQSVGPSCIVAWRYRHGSVHKGGGGHQFYIGTTADANSPCLPTISHGMDINAILGVLTPHTVRRMADAMPGHQQTKEFDNDELNAELALLPDERDENLR